MSEKTEAQRLAREFRFTMPPDAMKLWALEAVAELRRLAAECARLERKSDQDDKTILWQAQKISDLTDAQPAPVPEGWRLVPVNPTKEMWDAVNKLDDLYAAGSYDGKGCSIEQAWDCLLDATPTPPAVQPALAQEPVAWNKRIRDSVDALLEQAGYQPDSSARHQLGMMNFDAPPAAQRQWAGLTDEHLRKLHHIEEFGLFCDYDEFEQIARAIEAAQKETHE